MSCWHGSKIFGQQQTNKVTLKSICTISFNLANLGKFSLGAYLLLSKFRERKQQFLFCVHLLHKAGSPVKLGSFMSQWCNDSNKMDKIV